MSYGFLDIAMTPSVKAAQAAAGHAGRWDDFPGDRAFDRFTEAETAFIESRDSFYIATVSESGWPYVQHRGGPQGFLKVLDEKTLAFPDFRGNLQYISAGNLDADSRAALILMDYPHRSRLKIYARVESKRPADDPELARRLETIGYRAKTERVLLLHLEAFDWNCPQHITPRFTEAQIAEAVQPLHDKLEALAAENKALREQLQRNAPTSSDTPETSSSTSST